MCGVALLALAVPVSAVAQGRPYDFDAARQRALEQSAALAAAHAGADASRSTAAALAAGQLPVVSLNAQLLRYQKTVDVALGALREQAQAAVDGYLASLPLPLPPLPGNVLAGVVPDSLHERITDNVWRPTLTVAWPLYTGGAVEAGQQAAQAGVRQADAETRSVRDALGLQLVAAYFGQQLAAQLLQTGRDNLQRFELHLANARRLEDQGVLAKAQRLQVQVARDAAERQVLRATNELETAQTLLARLLREAAPVQPRTPLFVDAAPLAAQQRYVDDALAASPALARLRALHEIAGTGVQAAAAAWRPQVYGFGSYNFNARHALLPDPDWMVGVGIRYTLSGSVDRKESEAAARARERQAATALEQAGRDTETLVLRSWASADSARRQFLLLASNLAAAEENLRVQGVAFREGEATVAALIDAQVALGTAQTQQAAAAFEYDVALAQLLAASGRFDDFAGIALCADHRLPLPTATP